MPAPTPLPAAAISYLQALILGVLQGASELFPVSSLGHTVLFPTLFGWRRLVAVQAQASSGRGSFWLAFLVALHVGSALGLLAYFWRDWAAIAAAFARSISRRRVEQPLERLAWLIVVASIPAGVIALALQKALTRMTARPQAAALFLVVNGLILLGAESMRRRARARRRQRERAAGGRAAGARPLSSLSLREALTIGVAQSTALIAGISRDGVTMSAGLSRRLDHEAAARFAFLLATPIILAAGLYKLPALAGSSAAGIRGQALLACLAAAITAYLVVGFLVRWFRVRTLTPFALYCILFGAAMSIYTAS